MKRHLAIALALLLSTYGTLVSCINGKLTTTGESVLDTLELVLCEGLTGAFFPPGVAACPGSETLLKSGLDKVTEQPDAGIGGSVPVAKANIPLIRTKQGYAVFHGVRHLGYVSSKPVAVAFHSQAVQQYLDTVASVDAGADATVFKPFPTPPQAGLPLLDAGR